VNKDARAVAEAAGRVRRRSRRPRQLYLHSPRRARGLGLIVATNLETVDTAAIADAIEAAMDM
jgi:hypothetical protein